MGFLTALLILVLAAILAGAILLVVGSIYFDACNSDIPPGLEQPVKLRIIHAVWVGTSVLGRILENLHICSQIRFVRLVRSGWRRPRDPALFQKDVKFKHVPARIYQPKAPSARPRKGILYFHGGGFIFGSIQTHENICRYIARESESVVASVEYRLAPEHVYPAALNDCLAAATHFLKAANDYGVDPNRVILAGDSAGGLLAAVVCQTLATKPGLPKLRAQILLYPSLQALDFDLPSYQQNRAVPPLFRERSAVYFLQYLNGNVEHLEEVLEGSHVPTSVRLRYRKWLSADNVPKEFKTRGYTPFVHVTGDDVVSERLSNLRSPECSPLVAEDGVVRRLPETFLLTCEYDVLRDDGLLYKKRLEDNNVAVTWYHLSHGFHGILNFFDGAWFRFPSGRKGMEAIVNFVRSL
ncbi:arylacetamide deacetylase-like 4 [Anolis sagrei]|uniref:arylacetamide deacetylase-like 4 n=1 Tax=Anolis sagrei TaxID=38937 RepID=UPI0035202839